MTQPEFFKYRSVAQPPWPRAFNRLQPWVSSDLNGLFAPYRCDENEHRELGTIEELLLRLVYLTPSFDGFALTLTFVTQAIEPCWHS